MTSPDRTPIRILHLVAGMTRGGLETWLMNVMRRIDRDRFRFDFCTGTDRACDYDDEIRALGGRIIPCVWNRSVRRWTRLLSRVLREDAYDVVHAHGYNSAGIALRIAHKSDVRHRFAHLHTTGDGRRSTLPRVLYRRLMVYLVRRHATRMLACTRAGFDAFFGDGWQKDPRMSVVYYGVDLDAFEAPADRDGVRKELGIPLSTRLMIHVGRFIEAKNHRGLIDIFREVRAVREDLHLLLVGEGELLDQTRVRVKEHNLTDCVHFLGVRSDVPRLMKAADVMVMPSVREGMPVTMIEANAAGLPVVITDMTGTREANEVCCRARLLPVDLHPGQWARVVIEALDAHRPEPEAALQRVRDSLFASEASARNLEQIYAESVG